MQICLVSLELNHDAGRIQIIHNIQKYCRDEKGLRADGNMGNRDEFKPECRPQNLAVLNRLPRKIKQVRLQLQRDEQERGHRRNNDPIVSQCLVRSNTPQVMAGMDTVPRCMNTVR